MASTMTDMTLTLGGWGDTPLPREDAAKVVDGFAGWAVRERHPLRIESYMQSDDELATLHYLVGQGASGVGVIPVARLEPRSDRWRLLKELGVREAVIEVPVGAARAERRFTPLGIERSPEFAREAAEAAVLNGVVPEIALTDCTRAEPATVKAVVELVGKAVRARGMRAKFRLVDDTGIGDPLPGSRLPRSLSGWIRLLVGLGVTEDEITVQVSDQRGMALANSLGAVRAGAAAASTLFGIGIGAGWTATEALLLHTGEENLDLRALLALRELLLTPGRRDDYRPISGSNSWQALGGTAPEDVAERSREAFDLEPLERLGIHPEPLLTSLSGHAGLLNLLHRNHPELHFESDSETSHAISRRFEEEFAKGRSHPVSWRELLGGVQESGLLEESTE